MSDKTDSLTSSDNPQLQKLSSSVSIDRKSSISSRKSTLQPVEAKEDENTSIEKQTEPSSNIVENEENRPIETKEEQSMDNKEELTMSFKVTRPPELNENSLLIERNVANLDKKLSVDDTQSLSKSPSIVSVIQSQKSFQVLSSGDREEIVYPFIEGYLDLFDLKDIKFYSKVFRIRDIGMRNEVNFDEFKSGLEECGLLYNHRINEETNKLDVSKISAKSKLKTSSKKSALNRPSQSTPRSPQSSGKLLQPGGFQEGMDEDARRRSSMDANVVFIESILFVSSPPGRYTFNDFLYLITKLRGKDVTEDDILTAFKTFDADGSGTLSTDELKRILASSIGAVDEAELDSMIALVDADGSGEIDYSEFAKLVLEAF